LLPVAVAVAVRTAVIPSAMAEDSTVSVIQQLTTLRKLELD
jgi:hypothetical protein